MDGYVLLEIEGVGVLLTGDNDIKVGVTVELLERGHKLISDNNILVRKDDMNNLIGFNMLNNVLEKVDFFLGTEEYNNWMVGSNFFYEIKSSFFSLAGNDFKIEKKDKKIQHEIYKKISFRNWHRSV